MYAEAIQDIHGEGKFRNRTRDTLSSIVSRADLSIVVLTHSQEDILEVVSELSNIHLRFMMIKDTLFLQSLAPSSNLYSVILDTQSQMSLKALV
jgi:flavorubredoxin